MKPETWTDPFVEEVRKIREEHAARFDFDLARIFEDLKKNERESGREVVSFAREPKSPVAG
ncbi:MAG TPA: hypothetical protein VN851_05265 [Thermoanaerobaculia bacterium]|nr:hypothetical protein [Thermoanaerobaculia bacterium]